MTKKKFNAKEKAEAFNSAFLQFSNIDTTNAQLPNFQYKTERRLSDITVTEKHTQEILKDLNMSKASDPAGINARMLNC